MNWRITSLGQSGLRLRAGATTIYIDPYLSDSVRELEGARGVRMRPVPMEPGTLGDADWILVTHEHLDHFDPATLRPMAASSPQVRIAVPDHLREAAISLDIGKGRIHTAWRNWFELGSDCRAVAFRTSHPDPRTGPTGSAWSVGYVLNYRGSKIAVTGDTALTADLLDETSEVGPVSAAFLPVNERNYMRDSQGIIGNMTIREAFALATHLGAETLIPQHWDMFAANSVHPEEIRLLHDLENPPFKLLMPEGEVVV